MLYRNIVKSCSICFFALSFSACDLKSRSLPDANGREIVEQVLQGIESNEPTRQAQQYVPDTKDVDEDETVLNRFAYSTSYNDVTKLPNWVAWELTAAETRGSHTRRGVNFLEDDNVRGRRATSADYSRSGYDRGHMCPSADCKWSEQAQEQSFLLTNICPQDRGLNGGAWNDLEQLCRKWARRYGSLHIVCGPVFYDDKQVKTIGRNRVAVPHAFFKVVLRLGKHPQAIGFIYDNVSDAQPLSQSRRTVDEIERITGMDFYPQLPDSIENKVEAAFDEYEWK